MEEKTWCRRLYKCYNKRWIRVSKDVLNICLAIASLGVGLWGVPKWVRELNWQNAKIQGIIERLDRNEYNDMLVLFGGGTVQNYLKAKGIHACKNRVIIPAPSGAPFGCLKDDVFIHNLHHNLAIMSSSRAGEADVTDLTSDVVDNMLEVLIGCDTLCIRTSMEDLKNMSDKKRYNNKIGIRLDSLNKFLGEKINGKCRPQCKCECKLKSAYIYCTSESSGTWKEYDRITNGAIRRFSPEYCKEYTDKTKLIDMHKPFIVLTRTCYDPGKDVNEEPIYLLEPPCKRGKAEHGFVTRNLYLYILVSFDHDNKLVISDPIDRLLKDLGIHIDLRTVKRQGLNWIIRHEDYTKKKFKTCDRRHV